MGAIDANGVWIYDNSDHVVPISTYENLGQNSVSAALLDLRNDLTPVIVPWTNTGLIAGASLTLDNVMYMVDAAGTVHWRGGIYRASGSPVANDVMLTFPSSIQPTLRLSDTLGGLAGSTVVFVGSYGGTGALTELRWRSGALGSSATLAMSLGGLTWAKA